ncbi:uncharacterized protein LOC119661817 [Teleopsis dalmanni]|uniref:uncharacterized protein LOC119661817 n=1 Tax=Teleopsis dalmanni TaxID=139649 RepID=UPI0018CE0060|nr:uncharacterized protein LOC119661817 [Teleopsis dalmanni]
MLSTSRQALKIFLTRTLRVQGSKLTSQPQTQQTENFTASSSDIKQTLKEVPEVSVKGEIRKEGQVEEHFSKVVLFNGLRPATITGIFLENQRPSWLFRVWKVEKIWRYLPLNPINSDPKK